MTYEEIVCDANNLYKAYKASIKGSKWKETTQKFMINFLRYLIAIQDDLLNRTLQNGSAEEFSLSEEAGSGLLRASVSVTGLYGTSYAMKFFSRKSVSISFMTTVLPSREEAFRIKGIVSRSISAATIRCTVTRDGYYSGIFQVLRQHHT